MNQNYIKTFIEDFKHKSKYRNKKDIFGNYFLRGNFKEGFRILFNNGGFYENKDYYFQLDSEDLDYLVKKYTPVYEGIIKKEKEKELVDTRDKIQELNEKLKQIQNGQ